MTPSPSFAGRDAQDLLDRSESVAGFVVDHDPAVPDVVDPAMQANRSGGQAGGYPWVGAQMLELQKNVLLDERAGHVIAR